MAFTAKDVAKECEGPDSIRNESYLLNRARLDIRSQMKLRELESVLTVLADQFQRHGYTFLHHNFAGFEFEIGNGNPDDLFIVSDFSCHQRACPDNQKSHRDSL